MTNLADRDYLAEMGDLIAEATQGSDWVPALIAEKIVGRLEVADPALLAGWLHAMAPHLLTTVITTRERSARTLARNRVGARRFQDATESVDTGHFQVTYVVNDDHVRRRVRDMTGADHRYVADNYQSAARRAKMLAAFHGALAQKVGNRRTADVMSEDEYDRLYRSITGAAT